MSIFYKDKAEEKVITVHNPDSGNTVFIHRDKRGDYYTEANFPGFAVKSVHMLKDAIIYARTILEHTPIKEDIKMTQEEIIQKAIVGGITLRLNNINRTVIWDKGLYFLDTDGNTYIPLELHRKYIVEEYIEPPKLTKVTFYAFQNFDSGGLLYTSKPNAVSSKYWIPLYFSNGEQVSEEYYIKE